MLKSLSIVELVAHAKEETLVVFMSSLINKVFQILPANNMSLTTQNQTHARPSTSARTAPGHHAQRDRLARTNAGLLTTRSISLPTTIPSLELPK